MNRIVIVSTLALVAACASDPHKEVRTADSQLTQAQIEAQHDHRAQVQDNNADTASTRADNQQELADTHADSKVAVVEARSDADKARIEMREARDKFDIDAKRRFDTTEAKVDELRARGNKLTAKKRALFDTEMRTYMLSRGHVLEKMSEIKSTPDAQWSRDRDLLEQSLSSFERNAERLEEKL